MNKLELKALIDVANKRKKADLIIKNGQIIDVYQAKIIKGTIAICGKYIVGIGNYEGKEEIDANGSFISPGFIDTHIHIESTYLSPTEASSILVPKGTTTVIADPHEIVNVCGLVGLEYMIDAADDTALDIKYMLPSCVPCTPFETSGATLKASEMKEPLKDKNIFGLGEFMNYVGVNNCDEEVLDKIYQTKLAGKIIDGHAPSVSGSQLDGYIAAGAHTDHECSTVKEVNDRISRGMYVLLRQGSAGRNLKNLLPAITPENSRFCTFSSDDIEPKTIFEEGHLDNNLRISVKEGLDPITAIRIATINAAECYKLSDRGGIAPGLLANLVFLDNLTDFNVQKVLIDGKIVAKNGHYLKETIKHDISKVSGVMNIKDFSIEKLKLKVSSNKVTAIQVIKDEILTQKIEVEIKRNSKNEFVFDKNSSINKIAVIERHSGTGNVGIGLIKDFGIKEGAIAQTIAHDSHNLVVVGMSDEDMAIAVKRLNEVGGGIIVVKNKKILAELELPIAGLMSNNSAKEVKDKFSKLHTACNNELGITEKEPIVLLSFMALPVIPEIRITDKGLFDVTKFEFI